MKDYLRVGSLAVALVIVGALASCSNEAPLFRIFEKGQFYLPETHYKTDYERIPRDLVHDFIEEEYMAFPVSAHKDMMDSLSRIAEPDISLVWPAQKMFAADNEDEWRPSIAAYAT